MGYTNWIEAASLSELDTLVRSVPPATAVLCGGTGAQLVCDEIRALGAVTIDLSGVSGTLAGWLAEHGDG